jgi:hypothetical protein
MGWQQTSNCDTIFEKEWREVVRRRLLDPEFPESCSDLKEKITISEFVKTTPGCWAATLTNRAAWEHIFDHEEKILNCCIEAVLTQFGPWFDIEGS